MESEVLRVKFMWKMFLCHLGSIVEGLVNIRYWSRLKYLKTFRF